MPETVTIGGEDHELTAENTTINKFDDEAMYDYLLYMVRPQERMGMYICRAAHTQPHQQERYDEIVATLTAENAVRCLQRWPSEEERARVLGIITGDLTDDCGVPEDWANGSPE